MNQLPATDKLIQQLANWITAVTIVLTPLFFLPLTTNFFTINKQMLLLVATAALVLLWIIRSYSTGELRVHRARFDLPLLGLAGVAILSLFFTSTNFVEALFAPIGVGTLVMLTIFYFAVSTMLDAQGRKRAVDAFILSGVVLGVATIYQFLGLGEALSGLGAFLANRAFATTGSLLTSAVYLTIVSIVSIIRVTAAVQKKNTQTIVTQAVGLGVLILSIGVAGFQLLSAPQILLMPHTVAWLVAGEAFKNFPFFGVGTENYLFAFTQGRPASMNLSPLWNIRFAFASNLYLHLFTVLGGLGLAAVILFTISVFSAVLSRTRRALSEPLIALAAALIIGLLFPPSLVFVYTVFVLAALAAADADTDRFSKLPSLQRPLLTAILAVPLMVVAASLIYAGSVYASELALNRSRTALLDNRGVDTYNLQQTAITRNPQNPSYRRAYSQINLALAIAIAQNQDLSDQDRTNVTQLIQQSIREGRNAVILNPRNVLNWENLANVYRQLINFADGADQFSVATYREAVRRDPTNPLLRINYGGVFFALGNVDNAIRQFELAVQLKPDHANAHFNLAIAYRQNNQPRQAFNEMAATLSLLDSESNDYAVASTQLEEIRQELVDAGVIEPAGEPETLTTPAPAEEQLTPPIELPEEAAPPEADESVEEGPQQPAPVEEDIEPAPTDEENEPQTEPAP